MNDRAPILTGLARAAIAERLKLTTTPPTTDDRPWLTEPATSFVTLTMQGRLRGCIGSLEAYRPLVDDVRANAVAAAFHDPRFAPLKVTEFDALCIEVSVLSPLSPLHVSSEADACARLEPMRHGVVLAYGAQRGTFLPQVWEQLPDPRQFLAHLKQKAGLPPDFWHPDVQLYVYQVEKFRETGRMPA